MGNVLDFTLRTIGGDDKSLADYAGKVLLLVNVASKCGHTSQYEGLQKLHDSCADRGLVVLGIPCNQFGAQEPGTEAEIEQFCTTTYGVTFPMFSKIDVNGEGRDPLYAHLVDQKVGPDGPGDIAWNFAKFVVDRDGRVIARFAPKVGPMDDVVVKTIEHALD